MNRKHIQKPQVPARVPNKPQASAKLSKWWRPDRLHLAALMGPWSRSAKIGAAVVGALVLFLGIVNFALSTDWIETRVASHIKEKTGRDLTVNGSTLLLFTPGPYVIISDAKITDPDASAGADLSVGRLKINLDFADLFSRNVEAEQIVFVRPVLTVRLGEEDKPPQWTGVDPDAKGAMPWKSRFAKAQASNLSWGGDRQLHLKDVRIEDGTIIIVRDDAKRERRIEHINAQMTMPAPTDPLVGKGTFDWKRQTVDFSFEVTTPADLRAKRQARLQLALDSQAIAARFDGKFVTAPEIAGAGTLSAKAHSIPSILAWVRESPDVSSALGDGELASDVSWTKNKISFSNARFALEHARGDGEAVITLKRPRPHVRAAIALEHLDLDPFLQSGKTEDATAPKDAITNAVAVLPVAQAPVNQAPVTEAPAAQMAGPIVPQSNAALEAVPQPSAAAPAVFDADVNLNIRKTRAGRITIGPSAFVIAFRNGVATTGLGVELYGGHVRGTLAVDATKQVPAFDGEFHLDDVETEPLLKDAAQFGMVSGRAKLKLKMSGTGGDADTIKSSLKGDGSILVSDGAIDGIDLTALIRGLGKGDFDLRQGAGAKTAFSDLGGSFTIADGIAETQNLKMISPLLKVSADGTVDLARSNIDILARPEIVAGPEGSGGANEFAGLGVPVRIEGPLDKPRIQPQIGSLFADTESASKTVNKIGEMLQRKFKGKPVGEAIGRLLGGVQIGSGQQAPAQALAGPQAAESHQGNTGGTEMQEIPR